MVTGVAVVAAALATVLRQRAPEYALLLSLGAGVLILGAVIQAGLPFFEQVQALFEATGAQEEYVQILFKSLGVCFVVQIACDACRDMGETAIATKAELAGKVAVLVISLPLFQRILSVVGSLIG